MQYLFFILAVIIAIIIGESISSIFRKKKLVKQLKESFGTIPIDSDLNTSKLKSYLDYKQTKTPDNFIDDITWNDLSMDNVYKRICTCQSHIGKEYLYYLLHDINLDINKKSKFKETLNDIEGDIDECISIQVLLNKLSRENSSIVPLVSEEEFCKLPLKRGIYSVLACLSVASILLTVLSTIFSTFIAPAICLFVAITIINGFIYYKTKNLLESNLIMVTHFCKAIAILKRSDIKCIKDDSTLEENVNAFKSIKSSLLGQNQGMLSELKFLLEYLNIAFLIDIRNYNKSIKIIKENKESFEYIYRTIGFLDSVASLVSFRKSLDYYCKPIFTHSQRMSFEQIYHPLIENPIANDCIVDNNFIITGANATGKSTFIKAIAINNIFALTINTCCAKSYMMKPVFTITSMALRDDIISGESYYIAEVKSLKRILDKIDQMPCMCFVDEILRGTNTVERIASSISILKYIQRKDCICMVATHDMELANALDGLYRNYHFEENVADEEIRFDYKLKEGITKSKNAIKLLKYYGFDKEIIDDAKRNVELLEK